MKLKYYCNDSYPIKRALRLASIVIFDTTFGTTTSICQLQHDVLVNLEFFHCRNLSFFSLKILLRAERAGGFNRIVLVSDSLISTFCSIN